MTNQPIEQVQDFLDKHGVHYEKLHDMPTVRFLLSGENSDYKVFIEASEGILFVGASVGIEVSEERYSDIAEGVLAANNSLRIGNFFFPEDDILFKASSLHAGEIEDQVIEDLVSASLIIIDEHFPAFMSILDENESGTEAIAKVEIGSAC